MSDIASLANRVILIGKGKKLYDGSFKKIKEDYDYLRKIKVITKDKIELDGDYIYSKKNIKDGIIYVIDIRKIDISKFINILSSKISIIDIDIEDNNLDDIIVKLYEEFGI